MEDVNIIELFNLRSEQAIEETSKKYGNICGRIAGSILNNTQDAEECVNTAYFPSLCQESKSHFFRILPY